MQDLNYLHIPAEKCESADPRSDFVATFANSDPDLARIVESWPDLPAATKAGIMAMIDAS